MLSRIKDAGRLAFIIFYCFMLARWLGSHYHYLLSISHCYHSNFTAEKAENRRVIQGYWPTLATLNESHTKYMSCIVFQRAPWLVIQDQVVSIEIIHTYRWHETAWRVCISIFRYVSLYIKRLKKTREHGFERNQECSGHKRHWKEERNGRWYASILIFFFF